MKKTAISLKGSGCAGAVERASAAAVRSILPGRRNSTAGTQ